MRCALSSAYKEGGERQSLLFSIQKKQHHWLARNSGVGLH